MKYTYKNGQRIEGADSPREATFRDVCRNLLAQGISPGPKLLGEMGFGTGRTLGGNLAAIRIEEFRRAGWIDTQWRWRKPA